jgi:hypothetical protein
MNFFNTRHKCTRSDEEYQRPSGGIFLPSPLTWCSACDARPLFQVGFCQKAAQNKQARDSRISILNGHPLFSELAWNRLLFSELAWNISEFSKAFLVSSSSFHFGDMLEFSAICAVRHNSRKAQKSAIFLENILKEVYRRPR